MENRKPDYNENNKMVVRNDYVKAIHPTGMSVNAMKLFRLAIAQCKMNDEKLFEYTFKVDDLAKAFHVKSNNIYRDILSMCISLHQMVLLYGDPDEKWKTKNAVEECFNDPGSGEITIKLDDSMSEQLLRLKRDFTQISIGAVLLMKSKHAIRLFEVICGKMKDRMPHAGIATGIDFTADEIRRATGTDKGKAYNKTSNLKARIIKPAIADIEQAADWKIICTDLKKGRVVTGFHFEIWSRNGWEVMEKCKREGKLPPQPKYHDDEPTLFDYGLE